jgi:hypothetical protein
MTFGATLTRYEGWALLGAGTAVVLVWTARQPRHPDEVQANTLVFASIGGYGIVLWVLYNLIIFHDPLYFIHSAFSAQSQQAQLASVGLLGTKGSLTRSALTYGWTVVDVLGPVLTVAGAVSVVAGVMAKGRTAVVLFILAAPIAFNAVSLWLGQSTIRVPQVAPHGMWNDRYGLIALPLAAVSIGVVVGRWHRLIPGALAVGVAGCALMALSTPITVADGRTGTSSAADGRPENVAHYLHAHYRGGEVLADDSLALPGRGLR